MEPSAAQFDQKPTGSVISQDEDGLRLDRWFKRHFPALSHGQLQKILRSGQIRVDGKRTDSSTRLKAGNLLRIPPFLSTGSFARDDTVSESSKRPIRNPDKLRSLILYEDEDVVVINKPAGLAVQGGTGLKENLDDSLMALSLDGITRPKLVHRLDRDTSGVLLIARNDFAAMTLSASIRSRKTKKIYWAATVGVPSPEEGEIDAPLVKNGQIMMIASEDNPGVKSAETLYRVVESVPKKMAFLALWPLTGRTHQLRVHLAYLGTPIWKDRLYGITVEREEVLGYGALDIGSGLHLHARRLIIPHPRGKKLIDVTAPLSTAMKKTWRCFGFSENANVTFDDV